MTLTVIHHPSALVVELLSPVFNERGIPEVSTLDRADAEVVTTKPALTTEQGMTRALKLGALVGIPGEFIVTCGMGLLAGTKPLICVAIGGFCGLWGGVYMGAIAFLPREEEHFVRPPEWATVASFKAKAAAVAAAEAGAE